MAQEGESAARVMRCLLRTCSWTGTPTLACRAGGSPRPRPAGRQFVFSKGSVQRGAGWAADPRGP